MTRVSARSWHANAQEQPMIDDGQEALRAMELLLDDPEFHRLTEKESRFNVFDALGVRRQELRHSDFLSFVLDPNRPHGLGPAFLRRLLLAVSTKHSIGSRPFDGVSLRLEDWHSVVVQRERGNIDLIVANAPEWAVIIENKVGAGEHGDQLQRYEDYAAEEIGVNHLLFLYLTPTGRPASRPAWLPIGYDLIRDIAAELSGKEDIPVRIRDTLKDYKDYVEAHIMEDSEVAELCRRVYNKHKDAIDLLMEHVPKPSETVAEAASEALARLEQAGVVVLDDNWTGMPRWIPADLDSLLPTIDEAQTRRWTSTKRGILFEMSFTSKALRVYLYVGPYDPALRERTLNLVRQDGHIVQDVARAGAQNWSCIFKDDVITLDDAASIATNSGKERLTETIRARLEEIGASTAPELRGILEGLAVAST